MDVEAPADAWYVWTGVALASAAAAGIVLGLPSTPPPDAAAAANLIDEVGASRYNATGSYDHDARSYWIAGERLALRNEGGTTRARLAYGPVVPADEDPRLQRLLGGADPTAVFDNGSRGGRQFRAAIRWARDNATAAFEPANETLRVRMLRWRGERVVLVGA